MLQQIYYQWLLETHNDMNRLRKGLGKRLGNKLIPIKFNINIFIALRLLFILFGKCLYVFVFMFLPYMFFKANCNPHGFPFVGTMCYFTVVLCVMCGSLVNEAVFDMDEDSYILLSTMRMDPATFFIGRFIYNQIISGIGFLIAFIIVGVDFPHAFYLSLWIIISKAFGEIINLFVFRIFGKPIDNISGISAVIMTCAVFFAYAFPYLRGHVVDFTWLIYSPIWLLVFLFLGCLICYVIITFDGYDYAAKKFINRIEENRSRENEHRQDELEILKGDVNTEKGIKAYEKDASKGIEFIHKIFFVRSREYIKNTIFARIISIVIATLAGVIVCRLSSQDVRDSIWQILQGCMPLCVFIMLVMSVTPAVCKALFYHIDYSMLYSTKHVTGAVNLFNFFVRVRKVGILNLALTLLLCLGIGIVGVSTGYANAFSELLPVFAGLIILCLIYTVFFMAEYYLFQPYNQDMKIKNKKYVICHFVILIISYACVYIKLDTVAINLIFVVVLTALLCGTTYCIYRFSSKTFKIYK